MQRTPPAGGYAARQLLLGATCFLALFGLVMVYSASSVADYVQFQDSSYHLKRQLMYLVAGTIALFVADRFDYRRLRRVAWPIWSVTIIALVAVLFVGIGKWGATRWLRIGPVPIQPSEWAKLACVLVAAYVLSEWRRGRIDDKALLGRLAVCALPTLALVMKQPDMGTSVTIALAVLMAAWLGGMSVGRIGAIVAAGAGIGYALILLEDYRASRLDAFLNPWKDPQGPGYQIIQSLLAFGSGGLDGVGLGMSRQKFFYLPAAHTDFVFAIVGEELGLVGSLSVVLAFLLFAYAGTRIALGAKDVFGRVLAGSLTGILVLQAVMNMAAVTHLMPVTGIPLPFVSYGGSSLTFSLACVGLILGVSRRGAIVRKVRNTVAEGGSAVASATCGGRNGRTRVPGSRDRSGAARQRA